MDTLARTTRDRVEPATRVGPITFAVVFAGFAVIAMAAYGPVSVHHDMTEIVMWSGTGWPAGLWKHPPLLPWLFRATFSVLPVHENTIALLAALNITLAAWAVWRIARMCLDEHRAALALAFYALSPFVSIFALKLNHNAILVSLWPLTVLAFLNAMRSPTALRGAVFGAALALAMLAKYYSALLAAACLAAALASEDRGRLFRSPAPYAATVAMLVVLAPNLWWLAEHGMQPVNYALNPVKNSRLRALDFAVNALVLLGPTLAAFALARRGNRPSESAPFRSPFDRELLIISIVPFVLTVALTFAFKLRGATSWAMPIFSLVPVLIAARLPPPSGEGIARGLRALPVVLALLVPVAYGSQLALVKAHSESPAEPRAEIVHAAKRLWRSGGGARLVHVAGDTRLVSEATLSHPEHPVGFPQFAAEYAPWIDQEALADAGFVAFCRVNERDCNREAQARGQVHGGFRCRVHARRNVHGITGPWLAANIYVVPSRHVRLDAVGGRRACLQLRKASSWTARQPARLDQPLFAILSSPPM